MKTNRIILSIFISALIYLIYTQIPSKAKLSGDYYLINLHTHNQLNLGTIPDSLYNYADSLPVIRFMENDSVLLLPAFGKAFFGDTVFRYEVTQREILFSNGVNKRSMPYKMEDGVLMLAVKNKYIKAMTLKSEKQLGTSAQLIGRLN